MECLGSNVIYIGLSTCIDHLIFTCFRISLSVAEFSVNLYISNCERQCTTCSIQRNISFCIRSIMYREDYVVEVEVGIIINSQVFSDDTYIIWIGIFLITSICRHECNNPVAEVTVIATTNFNPCLISTTRSG